MGQISISEEILADIMSALREANHTSQLYDIAHAAMGVSTIDTVEDWSWAQNDGRTYLHTNVWNPEFVTIKLYIQLTGTIDWGDGSAIETYADTAFTDHEHTYPNIGKYIIILDGASVNLGNSETAHLLRNNDNLVQRYIDKIEFGHNVSRSVAQWGLPALSWVYYATGSPNFTVTSDGLHKNLRYAYFNNQTVTINGYGLNASPYMVEFRGSALFYVPAGAIHAFGNSPSNVLYMSDIDIQINRNSAGGTYFCYGGQLSQTLHFLNFVNGTTFPNYVTGSYFYFNMPSNTTAFNDSTSSLTIVTGGELHCESTTPPTLRAGSITCQTGAKIYVPVGCLETYQNASNWSALADYMQEEPS